jgi:hypothetical protein
MGGIGLSSVTYPVPLPPMVIGFAEIKIIPHPSDSSSRSPFTGTRQTFRWPGEYWEATVKLPPMPGELGRAWAAWLTVVGGSAGSFLLTDTSGANPRGSVAGAPVVNGASQTGTQLALRGFTANAPLVLRSGDWLQIQALDGAGNTRTRLYMNQTDVNADDEGHATINIYPRLRESPADGAIPVLHSACGEFSFAGKDDANYQTDSPFWTVGSDLTYAVSFDCVENI